MNSVPCTLKAGDPPIAGNTEGTGGVLAMLLVDLRARFGRPLTCLKHCRMVMIHLRGFWTI